MSGNVDDQFDDAGCIPASRLAFLIIFAFECLITVYVCSLVADLFWLPHGSRIRPVMLFAEAGQWAMFACFFGFLGGTLCLAFGAGNRQDHVYAVLAVLTGMAPWFMSQMVLRIAVTLLDLQFDG